MLTLVPLRLAIINSCEGPKYFEAWMAELQCWLVGNMYAKMWLSVAARGMHEFACQDKAVMGNYGLCTHAGNQVTDVA